MICSEVVNLFLIDSCPEIFTYELHSVKLIFEPWTIFGKPKKKIS